MRTPQRPKSEVRKIQLTGGSTYIVSLPKRWVSEHEISPKDQVRVEWRPSGNLRVMPEASTILRRRELEIDLDKITINFLLDHLIGAYLSGAQLIRIFSKSGFERKHRKVFRTFIQTTRGIEITTESEKSIEMLSLLNPTEIPLHSSINRMYLLVSIQIRDITDVLGGSDSSVLNDSEEREKEIDGLRLLMERQVGQILESSSLEDSMGINRWEASEFSKIVRIFERMGDHCLLISNLILEFEGKPITPKSALLGVIPLWHKSMKLLISNLRKYKINEVHEAKSKLSDAIKILEAYESNLWDQKVGRINALYRDKISESLRRICAYSMDMSEILINMHNHRSSFDKIY